MSDRHPRPRVTVHLDQGQSLDAWTARFDDGRAWERTPYSYGEASAAVRLRFSADARETRWGRLARKAFARVLGFDLIHAWRNRDGILDCDVVWTHTEREHLAVALLLKIARLRRRPHPLLLAQSVWLYDRGTLRNPVRRALVRWLLAEAAVQTTLSTVNAEAARQLMPGRRVLRIPFGVNDDRATPAAAPDSSRDSPRPLVIAPGNDWERDWTALARAAALVPELDVRIVAAPARVRIDGARPANLEVAPTPGVSELAELYDRCVAVAVPVVANNHASGATVVVEAAQRGIPIVTARAGGIEEYAEAAGALFYRAGDADELASRLRELASQRRHRLPPTAATRGLTGSDYAARHVLLTDWLLGSGEHDRRVEEFVPVTDVLATP
ncbi:glycosyltransferase [Leifsonia shinshuensis]|nr:glycosyltransferase [Leifsonia shinshuensis]